jgi:hypothetical protein
MKGGRQLFTCPKCGKCFFYWVLETVPQPKVKCYFCGAETFPNGEPPPAPAPPTPPAPAPVAPAGGTTPPPTA